MKCVDFGLKLFLVLKQFHSLAPMYYRGSAAAVIVYDITKQVRMSPLKRPHLCWSSVLKRPKQRLDCFSRREPGMRFYNTLARDN